MGHLKLNQLYLLITHTVKLVLFFYKNAFGLRRYARKDGNSIVKIGGIEGINLRARGQKLRGTHRQKKVFYSPSLCSAK